MSVFLSGEPGSASDVRAAAERALLQFASILIDGGATEAELASRFAELEVVITPLHAGRILAQLSKLGLARIGSSTGEPSIRTCLRAPCGD